MITSQTLDTLLALGTGLSDVANNTPAFKRGLEKLSQEQAAIAKATKALKAEKAEIHAGVKTAKSLLTAVETREAAVEKAENHNAALSISLEESSDKLKKAHADAQIKAKQIKAASEELSHRQASFDSMYKAKTAELLERENAVAAREDRANRIADAMKS